MLSTDFDKFSGWIGLATCDYMYLPEHSSSLNDSNFLTRMLYKSINRFDDICWYFPLYLIFIVCHLLIKLLLTYLLTYYVLLVIQISDHDADPVILRSFYYTDRANCKNSAAISCFDRGIRSASYSRCYVQWRRSFCLFMFIHHVYVYVYSYMFIRLCVWFLCGK